MARKQATGSEPEPGTMATAVPARFATAEDWSRALLAAGSAPDARALGAPPPVAERPVTRAQSPAAPGVAPERPDRVGADLGPRSKRSLRPSRLAHAEGRAELLARFAHHELQAAELMAWAVLRFPETPTAFRLGLARIAFEELEHSRALVARTRALGHDADSFPTRDWFWERVPRVDGPAGFCAVMGLGLEAANLDHARLWADRLLAVGDGQSARLQERIGQEEIAHVRFGRLWFERFDRPLAFDAWRARLPAPLTPTVFKGRPVQRAARAQAGLDDAFLDALEAWDEPATGAAAQAGGAPSTLKG